MFLAKMTEDYKSQYNSADANESCYYSLLNVRLSLLRGRLDVR
jgi:hypothetical protein